MFNKLFCTLTAAAFGTLLCLSSPAMAKLYKWVDENGVTQYTQTPPPKADFSQVKPPAKPAVDPKKAQSDMEKRLEAFKERRDGSLESKAEADKEAAEKAAKTEKCNKARKNLAFLQSHSRVRTTDKDGKATLLGEEKRQEKMKNSREVIKKYCK